MAKKLIFIADPQGKSTDELSREVWAAWVKHVAGKTRLKRCGVCCEYQNRSKNILCICSGVECSKCSQNRVRRPIACYFDENDAKLWHVPAYATICAQCSHGKTLGISTQSINPEASPEHNQLPKQSLPKPSQQSRTSMPNIGSLQALNKRY